MSPHLTDRPHPMRSLLGAIGVTAVGLLLLAFEHSSRLTVAAGAFVLFGGIGLAFAAMPNLIVEAVPPEQTGEATGFDALLRSVGASLGSQVTAAILAGSATAGALPTDGGFTTAFVISAGIAVLAAVVAVVIPRGEHHSVCARVTRPEPALVKR